MSNSIVQAFKALNVSSSSEDHENIFDISYQYLSNVKNFNDVKSFNNCLVALINLDKYDKALEIIKKITNEELIEQYSIEVGYVYYKTRQSDSLANLYKKIISKDGSDSKFLVRGLKHIVAQDLYQRGENEEALEIYHDLIKNNDQIDNASDLLTNELAIISQLNFSSNTLVEAISSSDELNYDLVFNKSLISLSNNETAKSLSQLDEALELLQAAGLDEESYELEKAPIVLVKAYIYQLQGKKELASSLLGDLKLAKFNDLLLQLIINNNYYSAGEVLDSNDKNVNLEHRALGYQENLAKVSNKLTSSQSSTFIKNNLLLKYLSGSLATSSKFLSNSRISSYVAKGDFSYLSFKVLARNHITNEEIISTPKVVGRKLVKLINKHEVSQDNFNELVATALILLAVNQITSDYNQSVIALEKLAGFNLSSDFDLLPGLIGSLLNLYEKLDATDKLNQLYDKIIGIANESQQLSQTQYNFFKVVGFKLLVINDKRYETILSKLHQINSQDGLVSNALLLSNQSNFDVETLLANVADDTIETDIESLIPVTTVPQVTSQVGRVEKKRPRKAKFGPNKVLKSADTLNLDPERWLPLKLRSNYKPKKSKKKVSTHQGAVETPSSSQTSTPAPNPPTSSNATPSTSKKANKKKKKGKK